MSNSTPQGPGPEFGSNPDASPITPEQETSQIAAEIDALSEEHLRDVQSGGPDVSQEPGPLSDGDPAPNDGDDDVIDISENDGPELTVNTDDVDAGSA